MLLIIQSLLSLSLYFILISVIPAYISATILYTLIRHIRLKSLLLILTCSASALLIATILALLNSPFISKMIPAIVLQSLLNTLFCSIMTIAHIPKPLNIKKFDYHEIIVDFQLLSLSVTFVCLPVMLIAVFIGTIEIHFAR